LYTDGSLVVPGCTCGKKDLDAELVQRFSVSWLAFAFFHADPFKATAFGCLPQSKTELSLSLCVIFSTFISFIPDLIEVAASANDCERQKK